MLCYVDGVLHQGHGNQALPIVVAAFNNVEQRSFDQVTHTSIWNRVLSYIYIVATIAIGEV